MRALPIEITDYLDYIRDGGHPVCKEQKKLADMLERIFDEEPDLIIDTDRLNKFMSYQKYFSFNLFPWEKFVFTLHNCVFYADGRVRFPNLFILCGRGAGKNGYLAFQAFCQMCTPNGVDEYDIDICATSEDQAKTTFTDLYNMFESATGQDYLRFKKHFKWTKQSITCLDTHSTLRFRTNNAKGKDGLRSGAVYFDEVHAYENWANIDVFTTGLGKKPCPRKTYITTNGDVRGGVLDSMIDQAHDILNGDEPDDGWLPFICKLDSPDEVDDEEMWHKANPSLQYRRDLHDEIRSEYKAYKRAPLTSTGFMTKRMNIPAERTDVIVTSWENICAANRARPDLTDRRCVCGIDYAKTTDMVGACLLFYDGNTYFAIQHSWFCLQSFDRKLIKAPLDEWADRGLLTLVDNVEIAPKMIADWIYAQNSKYRVDAVSIDSYRHTLLASSLKEIGYTWRDNLFLTRPSDIMKVQPLITSAFATHSIAWGDDPMMKWAANNAKLVPAANNNWVYGKIEPHGRKTDCFMAFVAAMCQEERLHEDETPILLEPFFF